MPRIYLAGPMTGLPEFNYPAFHAEAARLRQLGYHVENPAENSASRHHLVRLPALGPDPADHLRLDRHAAGLGQVQGHPPRVPRRQ